MEAPNARASIRKALAYLGREWNRYRLILVRILLLTILAVSLLAQLAPSVSAFIVNNIFLGFGVVIGLAYLLFETVISSVQESPAADTSLVLSHYSDLRPHVKEAFSTDEVELNIASYSGETFYGVLSEFLQGVVDGRINLRKLHIKLLVPNCSASMAIPCLTNNLAEDPDYKSAITQRNLRFAGEFQNYFQTISERFPQMDAAIEIKMHRLAPLFKMILVNHERGFFSLYPIAETAVELSGVRRVFWDFRGERVSFVGFSRTGTRAERELYNSIAEWFSVVWEHLAK